ncbi:MAG: ribonuclease E/G, partial [Pseudomonadales bacterium]
NYLLQLNEAINTAAAERAAPFLIYQESDVIIRTIRDYLRDDIGEILIDTDEAYEQAMQFVTQVMPQFASRIKRYETDVPLFNRYQIEGQIESAFQREVRLPSGGSIVVDSTEALVSIDINSARATRGSDIEDTALNTNLEAADEIARQLRLRDIGGLIVIDFIDMTAPKNQRAVEVRMRDALEMDRARVQIGRISRFGLLEMSRQRLRQSLVESSGIVCPRCNGLGSIRDVESSALAIMRLVEEEALKETSSEIRAFLPVSVASFLLNEKRNDLYEMEQRNEVRVVIVPSPDLETPHYRVERMRASDDEESEASYEIAADIEMELTEAAKLPAPEKAAVKTAAPTAPPPTARAATAKSSARPKASPTKTATSGIFSKFFKSLFGSEPEPVPTKARKPVQKRDGGQGGNTRRRRSENRSRRDGENRGREDRNDRTASVDHKESARDNNKPERQQNRQAAEPRKDGRQQDTTQKTNGEKRGNRQRGGQRKRSSGEITSDTAQNKREIAAVQSDQNRGPLRADSPPQQAPSVEPSAEPSAQQEPSAHQEPSANKRQEQEPSANKEQVQEPSAEPSANKRQEQEQAPSSAVQTPDNHRVPEAAEINVPHPSSWGRAANDPRINPGQPISGTVLMDYVPSAPPPTLPPLQRQLDSAHPSNRGRAANDPRVDDSNREIDPGQVQ